ncbi:SAV_6107 family HEPN domain-containing protein [Corynebacterium breve]|uniref:SAV_6107 family HEPN domain-containing protein n=1 Tax=Corynebacterium breve TaxID=3049799 RepID=A0ABY8VCZ6_9CORY|nr:SAV_6107 family HEPN domain-containing protein [Corynebacterium breve]WIM66982.1 SAV_6107 family HEPN domain-containing protein [Corynebacterium breve]
MAGSVISATTGAVVGATRRSAKEDRFLRDAEALLDAARAHFDQGRTDLALEDAYRAALRTAGAISARSTVLARKKRLPTNAWDKLRLTGGEGAHWAGEFSSFSALRGRVALGIEDRPSRLDTQRLISLAGAFYGHAVYGDSGYPISGGGAVAEAA